ncbi:hypothetical protein KKD20_03740 [Patescibacteria group bacterium]|nr:hypothetical protein [Patescibacteria group bacterium]
MSLRALNHALSLGSGRATVGYAKPWRLCQKKDKADSKDKKEQSNPDDIL